MHIPYIKFREHALKCCCEISLYAVNKYFCILATWPDLQNGGCHVDKKVPLFKKPYFLNAKSDFHEIFCKANCFQRSFFFNNNFLCGISYWYKIRIKALTLALIDSLSLQAVGSQVIFHPLKYKLQTIQRG